MTPTNFKNNFMKKNVLTFLLIFSMLSLSNAQITNIGGGLALSTGFSFHQQTYDGNRSGVVGISFKHIHKISVPINISGTFTIYFPHITSDQLSKQSVHANMLDVNGHYIFNALDRFEFYGLTGLDILSAWNKYTSVGYPATREHYFAFGLNLGGGTYMNITKQLDIYGELKYVVGKYHQFILNAGVLLDIDWLKKHEDTDL
jgi:hypothetical protein